MNDDVTGHIQILRNGNWTEDLYKNKPVVKNKQHDYDDELKLELETDIILKHDEVLKKYHPLSHETATSKISQEYQKNCKCFRIQATCKTFKNINFLCRRI